MESALGALLATLACISTTNIPQVAYTTQSMCRCSMYTGCRSLRAVQDKHTATPLTAPTAAAPARSFSRVPRPHLPRGCWDTHCLLPEYNQLLFIGFVYPANFTAVALKETQLGRAGSTSHSLRICGAVMCYLVTPSTDRPASTTSCHLARRQVSAILVGFTVLCWSNAADGVRLGEQVCAGFLISAAD